MKRFILLIATALVALNISAAEIEKKTYTFATNGGVDLYLDYYSASEEEQPCLIFVFGGAFLTGSRAEPEQISVYEYFVEQGWKVAAIDYRLGLKPLVDEPNVDRNIFDIRRMLIDAVDVATEDLLSATAYLVRNAKSLAINPKQIVVLGSSAGAITACQAEYAISNGWDVARRLPANFNYAGIISMAGAIMDDGRQLEWAKEPCPIMMFHGNSDTNVPYEKISLLGTRMFGSKVIAESLQQMGAPYWFYAANNVGHSLSWKPMYFQRDDMLEFANRMAFGDERLQYFEWVDDLSLEQQRHDFKLTDFIKANFAPSVEHTAESAAELN